MLAVRVARVDHWLSRITGFTCWTEAILAHARWCAETFVHGIDRYRVECIGCERATMAFHSAVEAEMAATMNGWTVVMSRPLCTHCSNKRKKVQS